MNRDSARAFGRKGSGEPIRGRDLLMQLPIVHPRMRGLKGKENKRWVGMESSCAEVDC